MGKFIIGFLVIWGGLWLLGAVLRVLGQIGNDVGQYLDRTRPARDKIGHAIGYPLRRIVATLMDYRLVDRFLLLVVVAFIAALSVNGPWLVQALDGVGGKNFPLLGWAIFGCAAGVAMAAGSRYLELGWLGESSIAHVPDIGHLRSGEAAAGRSFQVRRIVAVVCSLFLLSVLAVSFWRTAEYRSQTPIEDKMAAAAAGGRVATLNGVLDDAVVRLESDPRAGLRMLLPFQSFSKDGVRPDVGRVAAAAQQYLKAYRDETEKAVTEGIPGALARSEAFAEVDKVASLRWIGRLHEAGTGGAKRDLAKAFFFFEEASVTGDKTSSDMLDKLARVMVSQKDEPARQAAFRYWEPRAKGGNPQAQYWLSQWYGQSTNSAESKKSETWLGKVLNQDADADFKGMAFSSLAKTKDLSPGSTKLLDDLAPKYVKGSDQNLKDAAYAYLEQRANAGDPGSAMWMGFRFSEGDGVPKDDEKAREWYIKAAVQDKDQSIQDRAFAALGLPSKADAGASQQAAPSPSPVPAAPAPQVSQPPIRPDPVPVRPDPTTNSSRGIDAANKTITIPSNSLPNQYAAQGWSCKPTYRQVGNECVYIDKPANSFHNQYAAQGWSCNSTYRQVGSECVYIEKPANSFHNQYAAQGWSCNPTYRQVGSECVYIEKPADSFHNQYVAQGWSCNSGYRQVGRGCVYIEKPPNSFYNGYVQQGWSCNSGFKQVGNECWKMQAGQ